MKKIFGATVALTAMAIFISSAQAEIKIEKAQIKNGAIYVEGGRAQRNAAISWQGNPLGINSNRGGNFRFETADLPEDCVGRLKIGTEERDVVIKYCTSGDITVIEAGVPKTGNDGDHDKGVAWPNPRLTDNLNGTITDNLTGLIWLKHANCFGAQSWFTALSDANSLANGACGLTDGSVAGDWRLPNVRELHSLVDFGNDNLALPDSTGAPFTNFVSPYAYWSTTPHAVIPARVWLVSFLGGDLFIEKWDGSNFVTAVRGGS